MMCMKAGELAPVLWSRGVESAPASSLCSAALKPSQQVDSTTARAPRGPKRSDHMAALARASPGISVSRSQNSVVINRHTRLRQDPYGRTERFCTKAGWANEIVLPRMTSRRLHDERG